ncbi:hypothetical protein T484DRAFT_1762086 [Baffinella frigidus]|nr:hypothetical protein T484DRAFT_1762086 [Cryptophyta sp. CCMP2293]
MVDNGRSNADESVRQTVTERVSMVENGRRNADESVRQTVAALREVATFKEEELAAKHRVLWEVATFKEEELAAKVSVWAEERQEAADEMLRPLEAEMARGAKELERQRALAQEGRWRRRALGAEVARGAKELERQRALAQGGAKELERQRALAEEGDDAAVLAAFYEDEPASGARPFSHT